MPLFIGCLARGLGSFPGGRRRGLLLRLAPTSSPFCRVEEKISVNYRETMAALKKMGTSQNVKIYRRHGAGETLFGVSFANLNKLKQQVGVDQDLADQLWASGNADAMTLAILIAEPDAFTASQAEAWLKDIDYYLLADLFAGLMARSDLALAKTEKWTKSSQEYKRQCGYALLAAALKEDAEAVPDEICLTLLSTIEADIHRSPNRARHAMNMALIAIGIYKPFLQDEAIAAARRIGIVEVDHGETNCQTPPAEPYILKAAARATGRPPRKKTGPAKKSRRRIQAG